MDLKIASISFAAGIVLASISFPSGAGNNPNRGAFIGIEAIGVRHRVSVDDINAMYDVEDPTATQVDDQDSGYAIYAGFRFFRYLAVDAGYVDLGAVKYRIGFHSSLDCSPGTCTRIRLPPISAELYRDNGPRVRVTGSWPLNARFSLDGRVGFVATVYGDSGSLDPIWGFGVTANMTHSWRTKLFFDRLVDNNSRHGNVDALSLGLAYQF